jgi:hypothetical protein
MANTFKNAKKVLTASLSDVYEVPAATTAIVIGLHIANNGTANHTLDLVWTDDSDADTATVLAEAIVVPENAAFSPIIGKLVLEAGDKIRGLADTTSKLEVTVSVLEIS